MLSLLPVAVGKIESKASGDNHFLETRNEKLESVSHAMNSMTR